MGNQAQELLFSLGARTNLFEPASHSSSDAARWSQSMNQGFVPPHDQQRASQFHLRQEGAAASALAQVLSMGSPQKGQAGSNANNNSNVSANLNGAMEASGQLHFPSQLLQHQTMHQNMQQHFQAPSLEQLAAIGSPALLAQVQAKLMQQQQQQQQLFQQQQQLRLQQQQQQQHTNDGSNNLASNPLALQMLLSEAGLLNGSCSQQQQQQQQQTLAAAVRQQQLQLLALHRTSSMDSLDKNRVLSPELKALQSKFLQTQQQQQQQQQQQNSFSQFPLNIGAQAPNLGQTALSRSYLLAPGVAEMQQQQQLALNLYGAQQGLPGFAEALGGASAKQIAKKERPAVRLGQSRKRASSDSTHSSNGPSTVPKRRKGRKMQNTSSTYRGVSWNKRDRRWMARVWIERKLRSLGNFTCERKAALAVDKKLIEIFGENDPNIVLNFPDVSTRLLVEAEEPNSVPPTIDNGEPFHGAASSSSSSGSSVGSSRDNGAEASPLPERRE